MSKAPCECRMRVWEQTILARKIRFTRGLHAFAWNIQRKHETHLVPPFLLKALVKGQKPHLHCSCLLPFEAQTLVFSRRHRPPGDMCTPMETARKENVTIPQQEQIRIDTGLSMHTVRNLCCLTLWQVPTLSCCRSAKRLLISTMVYSVRS